MTKMKTNGDEDMIQWWRGRMEMRNGDDNGDVDNNGDNCGRQ